MKTFRIWLPMLAAIAVTAPLNAQQISAPEPRWQTTPPAAMADALTAAAQSQISPVPAPDTLPGPVGNNAGQANTPSADQQDHRMFKACAPSLLIVDDGANVPPLSVHQKFRIFYRSTYDPCRFVGAAFTAGISQARNQFDEYGQGAQGYGKRLGANLADANLSTFFARFLLPSLLHDDPRYFRVGTSGTFKRRLLHAVFSPEWTRRDNGTHRFNYSRVLGDFMATSVGNAYYPEGDRGVGHTFSRGATMIGTGSATAAFQEFWPDIKAKLFKKHKPEPAPQQEQGSAK